MARFPRSPTVHDRIAVLVIVRVRLYREALVQMLGVQPDLHVAGEAGTTPQALIAIQDLDPDVVLLDLELDDAFATLRAAREVAAARVVALGFGGTDHDALRAAEAGISGYVGVHQPLSDVPVAIRAVMRGEAPCDGRITAALLRRVELAARLNAPAEVLPVLTGSERRILQMVARGLTNKEIAAELVISVATVKSHVHAVLRKLDVHSRGAAADLFRRAAAGVVSQSSTPGRPA
jgi:DNA-binding NarL/FixJ family response regulator